MSALKGNKFLPILAIGIVCASAYAILSTDGGETQTGSGNSTVGGKDIQKTPKEEVELLAAQNQVLKQGYSELKKDLAALKGKLSENPGEQGIKGDEVISLIDKRLGNLLSKEQINPADAPDADNEITFEVQPEKEGADMSASSSTTGFETRFEVGSEKGAYQPGTTQWEMPIGYNKESGGVIESVKNEVSGWGDKVRTGSEGLSDSVQKKEKVTPYITIPSDSRIYDVQAVTALVGRIEKNGQNKAPWEFSATLSSDASLANGFSLPEIEEARVSGVAIGDMAGECVKGYITSITFIFPDGRIANSKGSISDPLARIADEYGNPCVPGVYFDNIEEVIAAQGTIAGLSSFASSIQKRQQSIQSSATSQSLVLDGSESLAALGAVGSGGLNKTSEILADKYEAYYSFVYVEPGKNITLLVDKNIPIDYNETGRKVRYEDTTEFVFN